MSNAREIAAKLTAAQRHGLLSLGEGALINSFTAMDADLNSATAEALYRRCIFGRIRPTNSWGTTYYYFKEFGIEVRAILKENNNG